jgi:cytochrome c-type biogenesis protein CcmH/NrfF
LRWKTSLLAVLMAAVALSQTPQIESDDVNRVAAHIACQCGGCKESVNCPMAKRGCHFCVPAKAKIYKLQQAGMSDKAIIDVYKQEFGDKIFLADPSVFYWAVPVGAVLLGLLSIYWFIRRMKAPVPAPVAADRPIDPDLARFQAQIDRETAHLD